MASIGALVSFALATIDPYFLNMFWQIPDGIEILHGHLPATVSYAISSGPLVSQEWLYEAAMAWFVQHGAYGAFVLICALAAAATPLLAYAVVRAYGIGDVSAGVAAILVAGARLAASSVRAETFAVDLFALELLLLANPRRGLWIVPCVMLWANLHASAVFAPIVALVFALAMAFARRRFDGAVWRLCGIAALSGAATLVTPFALHLWSYAFGLAIAPNPARAHLEAWRPLSFDVAGSITAVLPGLLVLAACGIVWRRRFAPEIVVAGLCLLLTLTHARYAMFLVVGWAPAIARTLELRTRLGVFTAKRPSAPLLAIIPIALYAAYASLPLLHVPVEMRGPWQTAAAIVAEEHLHGNAYAPYEWAAFLHWRSLPLRLLIDAHGDPYPPDVWNDHLALRDVHAGWRDVLNRRQISVVVLSSDSALAQALQLAPGWRRVRERDGVVAFARAMPQIPTARSASARRWSSSTARTGTQRT